MPNKGYRKYTEEELQTLLSLYGQMPLKEVAQQMGVSYGALRWQLHQMGITKPIGQVNALHHLDLEPTVLAYLAGLIDGEGTVSIRKFRGKWKPTVRIANTSMVLIAWLESKITSPSVGVETRPAKRNHSISYMFNIIGLAHLPLYESLLPYMVIKHRQLQLVIEYCYLRRAQSKDDRLTPRQMEAISEVRALNIKPLNRLNGAT